MAKKRREKKTGGGKSMEGRKTPKEGDSMEGSI